MLRCLTIRAGIYVACLAVLAIPQHGFSAGVELIVSPSTIAARHAVTFMLKGEDHCYYRFDFGDGAREYSSFAEPDAESDLERGIRAEATYRPYSRQYQQAGRFVITATRITKNTATVFGTGTWGLTPVYYLLLPRCNEDLRLATALTVTPAWTGLGLGKQAPNVGSTPPSIALPRSDPPIPGVAPTTPNPQAKSVKNQPPLTALSVNIIRRMTVIPTSARVGQPVTATVDGTGKCEYWLDFGDTPNPQKFSGELPQNLPPHAYATAGSKTITAVAIDPCVGRVSTVIAVSAPPPASSIPKSSGINPGTLGR